jgi:hypothetical protein
MLRKMLNDVLIVTRKEVLDILQHRIPLLLSLSTTIYLGFFSPINLLATFSGLLGGLQPTVDLYLTFFYMATGSIMSWGLTTQSFTGDKAKVETLLTTPLSMHAIWLGKTLALFLFCYVIASFCAIGFVVYVNLQSATGLILPSIFGGLSALFCPIALFGVMALNNLIQLKLAQPIIGQFVYFGFIFALYRTGTHFGSNLGITTVLGYAALILVILIAVTLLAKSLKKEKIILSLG